MPIKEGELVFYDPFNDEIELKAIQDPDKREVAPTIGYYAMFEYLNGFRKVLYWSKKQMVKHADRYSPAFSAKATGGKYPKVSFEDFEAGRYDKNDEWLYSSFWYKDFDAMACKTMLRQLISKWGIMSADMQQAYVADSAIIDAHENGTFTANIPDASPTPPEPETPAKPEPENIGEISIDDL